MADNNARAIIFLGGIFTPDQTEFIQRESKGVVQNAADALQKNIIHGLSATYPGQVTVLNIPYVGAYPYGFKRAIFPATSETIFSRIKVDGRSFVTVRFIKPFSRMLSAFRGLVASGDRRPVVVIYAAHLPFLWAGVLYRLLFPQTRLCLVLPDLPEFMDEGGALYRFAKAVETRIFRYLTRFIDRFVVLTKHMAFRMELDENRYAVVEGIAGETSAPEPRPEGDNRKIFMYSGTLAARYGIRNLLAAFRSVAEPEAELWICGEGNSRDAVVEASQADSRIKFFGQVSRDEVVSLQKNASVLVNPRQPEGDFVKYSFPSKTLEYMASARPVLMYKLPGVPEEYHPYFFSPSDLGIEAFAAAIEQLSRVDNRELEKIGAEAAAFVRENKSARPQCEKIVRLLSDI